MEENVINQNEFSKQDQARDLYLNSGLNQKKIAENVGVSPKTISVWVNDGQWQLLKESYKKTPLYIISQMNNELQQLNNVIAARPEGLQFPTSQEAEIRRKIITSINVMKERQSCGASIEMMMELFDLIKVENLADAQLLIHYANRYIDAKVDKENKTPLQPML